MDLSCLICGSPLERKGRGRPPQYCSYTCRQQRYAQARQERMQTRLCGGCGESFQPKRPEQVYCRLGCHTRGKRRATWSGSTRACAFCGSEFAPTHAAHSFCSVACVRDSLRASPEQRKATVERKGRKRRAMKRQAISEPYTLAEIAARDRYRCGLCRRRVSMRLAHPHLRSASIDHVIPLSLGGDDTRANVQLAHLECNLAKGVRACGEQLALIG